MNKKDSKIRKLIKLINRKFQNYKFRYYISKYNNYSFQIYSNKNRRLTYILAKNCVVELMKNNLNDNFWEKDLINIYEKKKKL